MAFTRICEETSFEPLITTDLPLAARSSFATSVTAFSAFGLLTNGLPPVIVPPSAVYKFNNAIPCSEGFKGIRVSAFVPVMVIPASN